MSEQTIEQEIRGKGLTSPRVTSADIEAEISSEHYFTADEGVCGSYREMVELGRNKQQPVQLLSTLTFCILVLRNGFTVTGESACASPENFDAELGRKIGRQNAVAKIWPLLGFRLRDKLEAENVREQNKASHDLQRIGHGGIMCVRCGEDEQTAHERPCEQR